MQLLHYLTRAVIKPRKQKKGIIMTNTTQHTPGPWINNHQGAIEARDMVICRVMDGYTTPTIKEAIANARLIAAAPELLEALKALSGLEVKGHALIDRLQFSETGRTLAKKIVEAIAKAEGK